MENDYSPDNYVEYVRKQPVWAFILLSLFTFGLYTIYWFFKGWRYLRDIYGWDIYPFWRGVFSIFFVHTFMDYVNDIAVEKGHPDISSGGYATGFVILAIVQRVLDRLLPLQYALFPLALMPFLFLIPTVTQLNYIYEQDHPNEYLPPFSAGEILTLLLGGIVFIMAVAGIMMGEV